MVFTRLWRIIHKLSSVVSLTIFPFCFGESKHLSSYLLAYFVRPPSVCAKASVQFSTQSILLCNLSFPIFYWRLSSWRFSSQEQVRTKPVAQLGCLLITLTLSALASVCIELVFISCLMQLLSSRTLWWVPVCRHLLPCLCVSCLFLSVLILLSSWTLFKDKIMKSLFQCLVSKQF